MKELTEEDNKYLKDCFEDFFYKLMLKSTVSALERDVLRNLRKELFEEYKKVCPVHLPSEIKREYDCP